MSTNLVLKQSNFLSRYKQEVFNFLTAFENCKKLRAEYDALGYSGEFLSEAILGQNAHLDNGIIADGFSSLDAIKNLMETGHATNLYKVVG